MGNIRYYRSIEKLLGFLLSDLKRFTILSSGETLS
jgi:hypothetical protein